jgi:hypothetical protein
MTPPEVEETRTRVFFAAFGFGIAALAAIGVLLLLGLKREAKRDAVFASPKTTASVVAPANQAQRTAKRRSEALPAERPTGQRSKGKTPNGDLFAPKSFWNRRLSDTTPIDPSSATLVQALVAEVAREQAATIGPWIGANSGSTPLYRVGRTQPRVRVHLDSRTSRGSRALQRAWASVPIPKDAKPAVPPDRHMTIWQPATDTLWDFFRARKLSDGWHAEWGGAIRHVSKSPGYYTRAAWPGASRSWGATASSLPVIGGTMLLNELRSGHIDHALALNVPAARPGVFAWPAQRTDGDGPVNALPEGARLRLDPTLDVSSLQLPRMTRMIALAAQRYGVVVRDQTHNGISFFAENPMQYGGSPYDRYFRGRTPPQMLANFPWDRLQVHQMHLCRAAPCERR